MKPATSRRHAVCPRKELRAHRKFHGVVTPGGRSPLGDNSRSFEKIEAEVSRLLEKLGGQSEALAAAGMRAQEIGDEGTRSVAEAV